MAKLDQVLIIEPAYIQDGQAYKMYGMSLKNPSDRTVLFKIKTKDARQFRVKPHSGVIRPNQELDIVVTSKPFEYDPNVKNQQRFMVQSMFGPEGEFYPANVWKDANESQIMVSKLKYVSKMPETMATMAHAIAVQAMDFDAALGVIFIGIFIFYLLSKIF